MKEYAFVVSKPLQLIIALSIMTQLRIGQSVHVIVVDSFAGARDVCARLGSPDGPLKGVSAEFVGSTKDGYRALRKRRFSRIFIDCDVGAVRYLELLMIKAANPHLTINVYEEGMGTYRTDLYSGIKKNVLDLVGAGTAFGGCGLTSNLYIYNPDDYLSSFYKTKVNLIKIHQQIADLVCKMFGEMMTLFDYTPVSGAGSKCNIYLSSWKFNESFLKRFQSFPGDRYIKPHPHLKDANAEADAVFLSAAVPAELVLIDLLKKYKCIDVYHHGSSIEKYIKSDRIQYMII